MLNFKKKFFLVHNIQGRWLCWCDFMKSKFNLVMCQDICEFGDFVKNKLKCWLALRSLWNNGTQMWYGDSNHLTQQFDTILINLDVHWRLECPDLAEKRVVLWSFVLEGKSLIYGTYDSIDYLVFLFQLRGCWWFQELWTKTVVHYFHSSVALTQHWTKSVWLKFLVQLSIDLV